MSEDYLKLLADTVRPIAPEQKLKQAEVDLLADLAVLFRIRARAKESAVVSELPWVKAGKTKLGQKEVPGPDHNTWISKGWAHLGAGWYNSDETPWCGFYVAWCMQQADLPYPARGTFASAAAWRNWGRSVIPQYGAVGVKARTGGNHVFIIVGITPDGKYYKALGGNQGNMVSIADILVSSVTAIRWPATLVDPKMPLPVMARGTVVSEA